MIVAYLYFDRQAIDFAVIEVGMGGRFDATNVVPHPLVCVITAIGLDHQNVLGSTLTEIAGHKCGIIKPGIASVVFVSDVLRSTGRNEPASRRCDEGG